MRLGFQSPSPFERIEHHHYGDDDWKVTLRKIGSGVRYSTVNATARFDDDNRAEMYIDHPGEISIFARLHIAYKLVADRDEMRSEEVAELIGGAQ